MLPRLRSALVWTASALTLLVMGPPYLLLTFFDRAGVRTYPISVLYLSVVRFYIGMKVEVSGLENVPPGGTWVVMPNHRSWWDIPAVLLAIYPHQLRFVAKKELGNIPLFGWCIRQAGHILIDRSDREGSVRTLRRVGHDFSGAFSLVVFPEGTRSPGRHLLPFKRGGFHLARDLGLPILPVSISGSEVMMSRHTFVITPGTVHVRFHPPVDPASSADIDVVVATVRETIAAGLSQQDSGR